MWLEIQEDLILNMERVDLIYLKYNAEIIFSFNRGFRTLKFKSKEEAKANFDDLLYLLKAESMRFKS